MNTRERQKQVVRIHTAKQVKNGKTYESHACRWYENGVRKQRSFSSKSDALEFARMLRNSMKDRRPGDVLVTVTVDRELAAKLDRLAASGKTASQIIREGLEKLA